MSLSCYRCLRQVTAGLPKTAAQRWLGVHEAAPPQAHSRLFSTSGICEAAAKAGARKPQVKKKTVLRKNAPSSGPRSVASKKKVDSGSQAAASGISKQSPFYREPVEGPAYDALDPTQLDSTSIGKLVRLPDEAARVLSSSGMFALRGKQPEGFLRRPLVLRSEHVTLAEAVKGSLMESAAGSSPLLLTGHRGTGKSLALAVAASVAKSAGAIVVYVPQALCMVNSSSEYAYSSPHQAYLQPQLATIFLKDLLAGNQSMLSKVKARGHVDDLSGSGPPTVEAIIKRGIASNATSSTKQQAVEASLQALAEQTEFPVAVILDEVEAFFSPSLYRDADSQILQSYELALPRTILAMLLGQRDASAATRPFALRRGAILCATTLSHPGFANTSHVLTNPAALHKIGSNGRPISMAPQHVRHLEACNFKRLSCEQPLTLAEAAQLSAGAVRPELLGSAFDDESILARLVESGGNPSVLTTSIRQSLA